MKCLRTLCACLTMIFFSTCEEAVEFHPMASETGLLVVEGMLTNERKTHRILITRPHLSLNGKGESVSGAIVSVSESGTLRSFPLAELPAGSGQYFTEEMRAVFGRTYTLQIQFQGKAYTATDGSVPVEPLGEIRYQSAVNSDLCHLVLSSNGSGANFVDHDISWQGTPACDGVSPCLGRVIYYDLKTIDANELAKPAKENFLFPVGSAVIRRKYSVSPAYRLFLRSMLSETEWRGGLLDVERTPTTTNLTAGAIGFFAVCTVAADTTIIVKKP